MVKLVVGDRIMNVFSVSAPYLGKCDEEKRVFLELVFFRQ